MSLLKLKERGLMVLLFFMIVSCDQLLPPAGSGELVQVKIRAVSIAGGAKNETVTRASGQKRMVDEPVIQDLGGGMFAEITVEEDVSALRDATKLETDKTFRVIALKHDGQTYLSHADFTVGGDSNYESADLHVPEGMECDFICISFNNKETMPAMTAANIRALALNASKDLLYQRITTSINDNSDALSFNKLTHQLTKVTLILDGGSRTITSVGNTYISTVSAPVAFDLTATENALKGSSGSHSFAGWETISSSIWQSSLRLLPTSGTSTLGLSSNAITVNDTFKSEAKNVTLPVLEVNKSYTVRINLYRLLYASSNIYWDGNKLTFAPYSESRATEYATEQYYQGVYFKWGSLVGISPVGGYSDNTSSGTVLYWPTNTSDPVGTTRTWNPVKGGTTWVNIPYYSATSAYGNTEKTLLNNSTAENFVANKGDICYYIDTLYRIPTMYEISKLSYTQKFPASDAFTVPTGDDNVAGRYQFATYYGIFTTPGANGSYALPAAGWRNLNNGTPESAGNHGLYWSGSAYNDGNAHALHSNASDAKYGYNFNLNYGFPVRCVLNE